MAQRGWRVLSLAATLAACGAGSHPPRSDGDRDAATADAGPGAFDAGAFDAGPRACPPLGLLDEGATDHEGWQVWPSDVITAVTASDLDGNGHADLVVASADSSLRVLLGDGAGSVDFVDPDPSPGWTHATSLATPDLDADGAPDLVGGGCSALASEMDLLAWRGLGDGTFAALPRAPLGWGNACPTVWTLHTPGGADRVLVVRDGYLGVFDAAGAEAPREDWATTMATAVGQTAVADLDGDGRDDFVVGSGNTVTVFDALGDGSFAPRRDITVLPAVSPSASGDLDGDGDPDVAMLGRLLRNDGTGALEDSGATPLGGLLADLDGDGDLDGVADDELVFNDGAGDGDGQPLRTVGGVWVLVMADTDLDGDSDLVGPDLEVAGRLAIATNDGDGHFLREGVRTATYPEAILVSDLGGDGELDIVVSGDDGITRLQGVGGGTFELAPALGAYFARPEVLVGLDLEDDRDLDLVRVDEYGSAELWLNEGPRGFVEGLPPVGLFDQFGFEAGAAGDLDGDARSDLVLANNAGAVWLLWNDGTAELVGPDTVAVDAGAESLVLADLDGDGDLDIATANDIAGTVSILQNLGDRRLAAARSIRVGEDGEAIAAGDVDGDGTVDLVVAHGSMIGGGHVTILTNDGAAEFSRVELDADGDPRAVALVDLDGDEDLDLAVACRATNVVRLFPNDAGDFGEPVDVGVGRGPYALAFAELDGRCGVDLIAANKWSDDVTVVLAANRRKW